MSHHILKTNDLHGSSMDPVGRDVLPIRSGAYSLDNTSSFVARSEPALSGLAAGMTNRGYYSSLELEDPILMNQRRDLSVGISPVPPGHLDNTSSVVARSEPALSGLAAGMTNRGYYSSLELGDPILMNQRRDLSVGISPVPPGHSDLIYERPTSQQRRDHSVGINPVPPGHSDMIYERPSSQQRRDLSVRISPVPPGHPDLTHERPGSQQRRDFSVGISPVPPGHPDTLYERRDSQQRRELSVAISPVAPGHPDMILERPALETRRDLSVGISPAAPGHPDVILERPVSQQTGNGVAVLPGESNVLFVDGLPTDCTRREVGHIFRPFIGFKDIKVIHKEPRRSGEKALVLCFVEFNDSKCAITAMEALQGYKFDDKKPSAPVLRINFAHFPFRLPSESDDQRIGTR